MRIRPRAAFGLDQPVKCPGIFVSAEEALRKEHGALAKMNRIMMDREGRILELKHEVNELLKELNRPPRYSATR